jgi:hypothetical protein
MKPSSKIPPKPGKDTIYVDVDDEITSIIDKVDGAKQKVVALVLPKRATVLQSVVNMRLLKRSSEKANKNVVLITSEEALMPLAGAAGLHVAKNLQSTPAIPISPKGKSTEAEVAKELPAVLSRTKTPKKKNPSLPKPLKLPRTKNSKCQILTGSACCCSAAVHYLSCL